MTCCTCRSMAGAKPSDAELKKRLSPIEYEVTQQCGTEPPFTGKYWNHKGDGVYHCLVCEDPLFDSGTKYDSGSGWPSFWKAIGESGIRTLEDRSHGLVRTELRCGKCHAHLGHVFDDGPAPTGQRYCINSASLKFRPRADV